MAIVKKREIDALEQMNGEELERFLEKLPEGREKIEGLFDFLDLKLENNACDHTPRWAMQYMMQNSMNFAKLSAWLTGNGGYCDCRIISEIADTWREVFDEN